MNGIEWIVRQTPRCDLPCRTIEVVRHAPRQLVGPDAIERAATWVRSLNRPVTWLDVRDHVGCGRNRAMHLLQKAAERGLLVRRRANRHCAPDIFEGPATQ